ncbi:unnamed protein product [Blepharisma stoltei]|uniref:Uncharacterized protein n=1 Tax=Blepharisma stoltei TaxID=1481888 RepID=A0AAU9J377_9CILI|nr:unnamed protein product [Blepharisma stoltei]
MLRISKELKPNDNLALSTKLESQDTEIDQCFIFDITKSKSSNPSWEEIKVTFVRSDHTSFSEYLVFDKTQEDLNKSVEEVMGCISENLSQSDRKIMLSYLSDIMRNHTIKKNKDILSRTNKSARKIEFEQENSEIIKSFYYGMNRDEISKELKRRINWFTIDENENQINQAFELIQVQKLWLQMELHDSFSERKVNMSISTITETEEKRHGEVEKRLEEIFNKREVNNDTKEETKHSSCLGKGPEWLNACQCALM